MATSHPFLLDSLLALTALHLAFLNPDDKRPWMEAALKYQNQACSVFSRVLVEISPENCGPAFLCAVFILLCATAYPCVAGDSHPFDPLAQVLETRRLLVGCAFLYNHLHRHPGQLKEWLRFPNDVKREENVTSQGTWNAKLVPLRSALLDSLRQVAAVMNDAGEPHRAAYQDTWDFLQDTISLWPLGGPRGGIISWPVHIGEDYIALLKQGDWIARILFLHYGVGMHLLSDKCASGLGGIRDAGAQVTKDPPRCGETATVAFFYFKYPGRTERCIPVSHAQTGSSYNNVRTFEGRVLGHTPTLGDGKRGAVASESAICSRHGIDILELGGNAADALVATVLCVGVIGMYHSGIGGGGFMLVRAPNGSFEFIDFRETAPAAAFEEMFNNSTHASTIGGLASGVPGELRGLEHLHKLYGSLPWSVLVQPAIRTAREGFPVGRDLVKYMKSAVGDGKDFLVENPTWALDFAPNGTRVGLGDIMTRRRYADTLETIANKGPDAFYSGPIAETMINALQAANGTMTMEDLRNYTVAIRNVSQIDYRGYQITSTSAPSSGTVAMSILKILSTYDDFFAPGNVNLSTHRLDEAMRFGYGERTNLGDPLFVAGLDEYEEDMLNQSTIDEIRRKISDYRTHNVSAYDPQGIESLNEYEYPSSFLKFFTNKPSSGTSHVVAADHTGLAISLVTTINTLFGSQVMVPETGIIMNNEMDDFSVPGKSNSFGYAPSKANYIRPGKRPLSSITPAIVTRPDGKLFFLAGSAGGSRIITATVQNIIRVIDQGLSAAQALAQPRLHDQLIPNQVTFEYTYDNSTVDFMKSRGHNVTWVAPGQSTAQAIRVLPNGTFDAAGEPRQLDSGGFSI
ncbi:gamma-glutamyltranspeptidase 1 [Aspergillus lentulus]|uniref:Glutathione hydrolase n=1 Tax=Aspergillus lentulus TaxID=293939 RepID=A0AAN4T992_ASPLE|nr:gamma-glutamyltranspeptidase 1 [Aspergillus lentulus]